jgi:hypothetical protein
MKYCFLLFILTPLLSISQIVKQITYTNLTVGFSVTLDSSWVVVGGEKEWRPINFFNTLKNEKILIGFVPAPKNIQLHYTNQEAETFKAKLLANFQAGKVGTVTVDSIWSYPSNFLGHRCIIISANMQDPNLLSGVRTGYKSIQFLYHNYLVNIIACVPLADFKNEIKLVDASLQTARFFAAKH